MKKRMILVGALAPFLLACGEATPPPRNDPSGAAGADARSDEAVHSGVGAVTAISGDRVSIEHGPIASLGWPAMTMTFRAHDPAILRGISVGERVSFRFRRRGNDYPLTSLSRAQ